MEISRVFNNDDHRSVGPLSLKSGIIGVFGQKRPINVQSYLQMVVFID